MRTLLNGWVDDHHHDHGRYTELSKRNQQEEIVNIRHVCSSEPKWWQSATSQDGYFARASLAREYNAINTILFVPLQPHSPESQQVCV